MYPHEIVLEECNQKWSGFFSTIQHKEEHKMEILFLSDETKEMLEKLKFIQSSLGGYSQISNNNSQFFNAPGQKSGNMVCKFKDITIHIDLTVEDEKILFFDLYTEEEDDEEDWWNPKPILMNMEFSIIRHCMEEFKLFNFIEKAQETYLKSVSGK